MEEFDEMSVQKFEAVCKEMRDGHQDAITSINTIRRAFPDPEERKAFRAWIDARLDARLAAQNGPGITAEEFVQLADSANLLDDAVISRLSRDAQTNLRPWVPIGFVDNVVYRLVPEAFGLQAQPRDDDPEPAHRPLLPPSFLGINSTVQPREPAVPANRRQANLSEASTCSAESDDANAPGFVFCQLGELEYAARDGEAQGWPDEDDVQSNTNLCWSPSGFHLVARLSPSGHADGIFAIYDMFPWDEDDGERHQITHTFWGIPPSSPIKTGEQFSCAKIGQRLSEFAKDRVVVWTDKIEHPVELVRVMRAGDGRALRATVDDKTRWAGMREGSGTDTGSEY